MAKYRVIGRQGTLARATHVERRAKLWIVVAAPRGRQTGSRSPLQMRELVPHVLPFVRIGGRGLALYDRLPQLRQLGVQSLERLLVLGHVVLGEDRLHRALRHAQRAVDAFVGIDHQEVGPFPEAVDGADVDAIGIFAANAALGDDVGHGGAMQPFALNLSRRAPKSSRDRAMPLRYTLVRVPLSARSTNAPPVARTPSMSDMIKHVSDTTFDKDVLQSANPVLVDFWAEWCGPCKMFAPVLDEVAKAYEGKLTVAKLDIDANPATPGKFGIRGIPTVILYKDGQVHAQK